MKCLALRAGRIDDHELVPLEQPERAAVRSDRCRDAVDHHSRDLLRGQRRRERRRELLQPLDAKARPVSPVGRGRSAFMPSPHPEADGRDDGPEDERDRPPEVDLEAERKAHPRVRQKPACKQPGGDHRCDATPLSSGPHRNRHRPDERCVRDVVAHGEDEQRSCDTERTHGGTDCHLGETSRWTAGAELGGAHLSEVLAECHRYSICLRGAVDNSG